MVVQNTWMLKISFMPMGAWSKKVWETATVQNIKIFLKSVKTDNASLQNIASWGVAVNHIRVCCSLSQTNTFRSLSNRRTD